MKDIKITDSISEMIDIGEQIADEKSQIYNEWGKVVRDNILKKLPSLDNQEVDKYYYRSIYDYWVYGCRIDEWFHYRFFEKKHQQKSEYITCRSKFMYIKQMNDYQCRNLLDDKFLTYHILKPYFERDIIKLESVNDYDLFVDFVSKHNSFVVKPINSTYGSGVYKLCLQANDDTRSVFLNLLKDKKENGEFLSESRAVVLEEIIIQGNDLEKMHPGSVNCVRINTLLVNGEVKIFKPFLKIGVGSQFVTSGASGSLLAGIDPSTGVIITNGFSEIERRTYATHPDTGVLIKGFQIPQWEELLALSEKIAKEMKNVRFIGWDMAFTPKGWCILEGNFAGDFIGMQLPYSCGCKSEFENMIEWQPNQRFWWK